MRRPLALLPLLLLALVLPACGTKSKTTQQAETEGLYVDVAGLKYQVQSSRQLNELTTDDQSYLQGLAPADARLRPDEEFFAVFLRVENDTGKRPLPSAAQFQIRDSLENVYTPLAFPSSGGAENVFAYRSAVVPPKNRLPIPDSPAGERPPYGAILVFKLRRFSIDNRPLELVIKGAQVPQSQATINLDV